MTTDVEPLAPPPGQAQLGPLVDRFDAAADRALEHLRGRPFVDRIFLLASEYGDFSAIWHGASLIRCVFTRRPDQVVVLAAALGAESLIVNQGAKRVFRRPRPTVAGDARLPVRRPSTSSFPSGHASAAAFAATVLSQWDRHRAGALWYVPAAVVAVSRAHVRIHHASDVVGGIIVGRALGLVARRALRRWGPVH